MTFKSELAVIQDVLRMCVYCVSLERQTLEQNTQIAVFVVSFVAKDVVREKNAVNSLGIGLRRAL